MQHEGYWYKDAVLYDVSTGRHILFLIDHPDMFGMTKEHIEESYKNNKEKIGIEGKSRKVLILEAYKYGWIRVRHYISHADGDYWSIQFYHKDEKVEKLIDLLQKRKEINSDDRLILWDYETNKYETRFRNMTI